MSRFLLSLLPGLLVALSLQGSLHAQQLSVWQAAYAGNTPALAALLAQDAAQVDLRDPQQGGTPLHWAAFGGRADAAALLLERGAKIDARNRGGRTPLHNAAFAGAEAVVQVLLARGADVAARDLEGNSARDWAETRGRGAVAALLAAAEAGLLKTLGAEQTPEGAVWLDTYDLDGMTSGWLRARGERSVDCQPLRCGGQGFAHGLGTNAVSTVTFELHGLASRFVAAAGIDSIVGANGCVDFRVLVDGQCAANLEEVRGGEAPRLVSVDLTGAQQLTLEVGDGGDGIGYDHADWAGAAVFGPPAFLLSAAAERGDLPAVAALLEQHPELQADSSPLRETGLAWALANGTEKVAETLRQALKELPAQLRDVQAPNGAVWLENLEPAAAVAGDPAPPEKAYPDTPIHLGGAVYARGLRSGGRDAWYEVALGGQATRLSLLVGLQDENGEHGRLRFVVRTDGRLAADSGFMRGGQAPRLLVVALNGVQKLSVRVDCGGDGGWANAVLGGGLLELAPGERCHAAAVCGRVGELERLLAEEPDALARVDGLLGQTPLVAACLAGEAEAAELLVRHGADANAVDGAGNSLLHLAARRGRAAAVAAAARAGTDPRLRNASGRTAHELAVAGGAVEAVAQLVEAEQWWAPRPPATPPAVPPGDPARRPYVSPVLHSGDPALEVQVPVRGWKDLYLLVDDAGWHGNDWSDWCDAKLLTADGRVVYLDTLKPAAVRQGWGEFHRDGKSVVGKPLALGGKRYERGLGTHAQSVIHYVLPEACERFTACVGVDAAAPLDGGASVRFVVTPAAVTKPRKEGSTPATAEAEVDTDAEAYLPALPADEYVFADLQGRPVRLRDLRGKIVALFFYLELGWEKSFKYPWLQYAQQLQESAAARRGDLAVLVCTPNEAKRARAFVQEWGFTFPVVFDPEDTLRARLGLYAMPAAVFDRNGGLLWQQRMWQRTKVDDGGLMLAVGQALAGTPHAPALAEAPVSGEERPPVLFADFEHGYEGWSLKGDCWGGAPATDAVYPGLVAGYGGRCFAQSFARSSARKNGQCEAPQLEPGLTGVASSALFTIERPYLHFLLGGGDLASHTALALVVDGCTVRRATGENTAELTPRHWYVGDLAGKQAHLEIIDAGRFEARDYILVDDILFADSPELPERYCKTLDPNDPVDAVREKADFPAYYRSLLDGQVHVDVRPGRSYEITWEAQYRWPEAKADWLCCPQWFVPPTHVGHTLQKAEMTVEAGDFHFESGTLEAAGRPRGRTLYAFLPAARAPGREATVRVRFELVANVLEVVAGPPAVPAPDLSPAERTIYTQPGEGWSDYNLPAARALLDRYKLRLWPGETDLAFLLRASRWFQRYWSYSSVGWWAGYPSKAEYPLGVLDTRTSDCGNAGVLMAILRANGIVASSVQGAWLADKGEEVGAHVRVLVFLRNLGWVWLDVGGDLLPEGGVWGDGFVDTSGGDGPVVIELPQPKGEVLTPLEVKGKGPWRSRVIKQPELVPLSPTADSQGTLWRYTGSRPATNWAAPDFDDRAWQEGEAGFGTGGLNIPERKVGTAWGGGELWLRRQFTVAAGQVTAPRLRVRYDADTEVYLNGALAATLSGGCGDYRLLPLSTEAYRALQPGRNVLAVHCRSNGAPDYVDVGLVDVRP